MIRLTSMRGEISPLAYGAVAPLLILSQHALVTLAYRLSGERLDYDVEFWLLPLGRLAVLPGLSPLEAALVFTFGLAIAWALAVLSFRRASRANRGHALAAISVVPILQIIAIASLALMTRRPLRAAAEPAERPDLSHRVQGVLAGVAIIVVAVLVSAVTFGAYGWGLFVLTPFTVGMTTAYIANRDADLGFSATIGLVLWSAALGSLALIMFALEGLVCIIMAAPLGVIVALFGAVIGHSLAEAGHRRGKPLLVVAFLPAAFALEAGMPPSVTIATQESIDIAASPAAVWRALTTSEPIASSPGVVAQAGLAYPIRGRILGDGVGALRLGEFSTGTARERITEWEPGRRLAFEVLSQPPAMEEMSPYRRVHAPHVHGYFDTGETRFAIDPLPSGRTRLTVRAAHVLRIDPVIYWEPIARWAVHENSRRVLRGIRDRAEQSLTGRRSRAAGAPADRRAG